MEHKCSNCNSTTRKICSITNLHLTGDSKIISIDYCLKCDASYLFIYINANISYGENTLLYQMKISSQEKRKLFKLIKKCPKPNNENCNCSIHSKIDLFESKNSERREIILDEIDRW